ncbi:FAD:protein FMN transferase [Shewanella cyperi]|uniref:FAD:protein FMN transferase n=1 Tax=Shewanella cyperi TaxID=2814292 RepID=UPI001D188213|nr:FAD:protein FMN transferase [Shewanella cyperi]
MTLQRRARPLLGTLVELTLRCDDSAKAQAAFGAAFAVMAQIDSSLSFHRPDSELSRLNAHPGQWQPMGRHGLRILRLARALGRRTEDKFNVTVGGSLVERGALPRHKARDFLTLGSWRDIELGPQGARLARPVLLTLDGIAKGYAVDLAVRALKAQGIQSGSVNAGGDIRVFGDMRLALRQRRCDGLSAPMALENMAIASSRLGGAADPSFPSLLLCDATTNGERMLSVAARFAWRADALTKVAAWHRGPELLAELGGTLVDFD